MEYRHPDGHLFYTSRTRNITIVKDGKEVQAPSTILDKQPLEVLHQYGFRRVEQGPKLDERYYTSTPVSDTSVDGLEKITYTQQPRLTVAEAQEKVSEAYYNRIEPVVIRIHHKIVTYQATGQTAKENEWQAVLDAVRPKYLEGIAEFQRVMSLPEEERYEGLISLYQKLDSYIVELPE